MKLLGLGSFIAVDNIFYLMDGNACISVLCLYVYECSLGTSLTVCAVASVEFVYQLMLNTTQLLINFFEEAHRLLTGSLSLFCICGYVHVQYIMHSMSKVNKKINVRSVTFFSNKIFLQDIQGFILPVVEVSPQCVNLLLALSQL